MDKQSGDYISLNGYGVLRATYYNKGAFDMFNNYAIERGMYKTTKALSLSSSTSMVATPISPLSSS